MRMLGLLLQVVGSSVGGVALFALGAGSLKRVATATGLSNEYLFALAVLSITSGILWKIGNKLYQNQNTKVMVATAN